jgi:hypothetical protein
MTRKIYKSALGKSVDIGALLLQNEQVRAVGNMNVNARGDILDSQNRVIEPRNKQVQRKYRRQSTQGKNIPVSNSTIEARQAAMAKQAPEDTFEDLPMDDIELDPVFENPAQTMPTQTKEQPRGGLAAAIARTREINQKLEKTPRQIQREQNLKKI